MDFWTFMKIVNHPYGITGDLPLHVYHYLRFILQLDSDHLPKPSNFADALVHYLKQNLIDYWLDHGCIPFDLCFKILPTYFCIDILDLVCEEK